jgi:hypothetical protein
MCTLIEIDHYSARSAQSRQESPTGVSRQGDLGEVSGVVGSLRKTVFAVRDDDADLDGLNELLVESQLVAVVADLVDGTDNPCVAVPIERQGASRVRASRASAQAYFSIASSKVGAATCGAGLSFLRRSNRRTAHMSVAGSIRKSRRR